MKRLIRRCAERVGETWYAYHGTDKSNLESIMENGIEPSGKFGMYVFLAGSKDAAFNYAGFQNSNPVVLKVKLEDYNIEEIKNNNDDFPFEDFFKQFLIDKDDGEFFSDELEEDRMYLSDVIELLKEYNGETGFKEIENQALEEYFKVAELITTYIEPDQIVEVFE